MCVEAQSHWEGYEARSVLQAMKLMNEIEAEVGGTVVKWVAEDAGTIDPGDVICVIDPSA